MPLRKTALLTSSQRGRSMPCSTWQALVVTELVPAHHRSEKSQGAFTTNRLTEMLSRRYSLRKEGVRISRGQHSRTGCKSVR